MAPVTQAMGKSEAVQATVLDAVGEIVRRKRSATLMEAGILGVADRLPGIDKARFMHAWRAFGVKTMLARQGGVVSNNDKVDDGRYMTSPGQVDAATRARDAQQVFQATLQVAGVLVRQAQKAP